jgi:hypothetical protein
LAGGARRAPPGKGSTSFLKKNQKNYVEPVGAQEEARRLVALALCSSAARLNIVKNLLLLFFRKELLFNYFL